MYKNHVLFNFVDDIFAFSIKSDYLCMAKFNMYFGLFKTTHLEIPS